MLVAVIVGWLPAAGPPTDDVAEKDCDPAVTADASVLVATDHEPPPLLDGF
jgi:hypothetical protein